MVSKTILLDGGWVCLLCCFRCLGVTKSNTAHRAGSNEEPIYLPTRPNASDLAVLQFLYWPYGALNREFFQADHCDKSYLWEHALFIHR